MKKPNPKRLRLVGKHIGAVGSNGYKRTMYLYATIVGDKWEILMRCVTTWPKRFATPEEDECGWRRAKWTAVPKWLAKAVGVHKIGPNRI